MKLWRRNPEQERARITTENEKENIKVCLPLSSWGDLFLPVYREQWTQFILCFSLFDDMEWRVLAN